MDLYHAIQRDPRLCFARATLAHIDSVLDTYGPKHVSLCFNGGKDCTVLLHLLAAALAHRGVPTTVASIPIVYFKFEDELAELDTFIADMGAYYNFTLTTITGPTMKACIATLLQQFPDAKAMFMGQRLGDPGSAYLSLISPSDPTWPPLDRVNSILTWSYQQVWQFLLSMRLPYCKLYDLGYTSLGARALTVPNPLLCRAAIDDALKQERGIRLSLSQNGHCNNPSHSHSSSSSSYSSGSSSSSSSSESIRVSASSSEAAANHSKLVVTDAKGYLDCPLQFNECPLKFSSKYPQGVPPAPEPYQPLTPAPQPPLTPSPSTNANASNNTASTSAAAAVQQQRAQAQLQSQQTEATSSSSCAGTSSVMSNQLFFSTDGAFYGPDYLQDSCDYLLHYHSMAMNRKLAASSSSSLSQSNSNNGSSETVNEGDNDDEFFGPESVFTSPEVAGAVACAAAKATAAVSATNNSGYNNSNNSKNNTTNASSTATAAAAGANVSGVSNVSMHVLSAPPTPFHHPLLAAITPASSLWEPAPASSLWGPVVDTSTRFYNTYMRSPYNVGGAGTYIPRVLTKAQRDCEHRHLQAQAVAASAAGNATTTATGAAVATEQRSGNTVHNIATLAISISGSNDGASSNINSLALGNSCLHNSCSSLGSKSPAPPELSLLLSPAPSATYPPALTPTHPTAPGLSTPSPGVSIPLDGAPRVSCVITVNGKPVSLPEWPFAPAWVLRDARYERSGRLPAPKANAANQAEKTEKVNEAKM